MNEWDQIRQKCPKLYVNSVYFECGPGWTGIISDLSEKIEEILNKYPENEMFAVQVKEKYGTLCFYMSCETDEISDLIHDSEVRSSLTCESCGQYGTLRGTKWVEVRCKNCYERDNEKRHI